MVIEITIQRPIDHDREWIAYPDQGCPDAYWNGGNCHGERGPSCEWLEGLRFKKLIDDDAYCTAT